MKQRLGIAVAVMENRIRLFWMNRLMHWIRPNRNELLICWKKKRKMEHW